MPRLRRTKLFVSGSDTKALDRARTAGADSLILDLEDTVTPDAQQATEGSGRKSLK